MGSSFHCTDQQEYFEHLNRFLLLIEPLIEDLERKKFIRHIFNIKTLLSFLPATSFRTGNG